MNRHAFLPAALLVVACLVLAACSASSPLRDSSSQEVLKQRAEQRWQYLADRDAAKAWDYLTPGYRQTVSRDTYAARMNNRPIRWTSGTVTGIECEDARRCTVQVTIGFTTRVAGVTGEIASMSRTKEDWLYLNNQWYHLPRETGGLGRKGS